MSKSLPLLSAMLLAACEPRLQAWGPGTDDTAFEEDTGADTAVVDTGDTDPAPCAEDMVLVGDTCMDLYEAPNVAGALPLVMYTFVEAEAWCDARDKRLCYDDEWQGACEGSAGFLYPYGSVHLPGTCNDEEVWRTYSQTALNGWPMSASGVGIESLEDLFTAVRVAGGSTAAEHVEWLYQGEGSGDNRGCVGEAGVYDLVGNVEEWTRRRDGGEPDFHGNLKGRYWAEVRTCQSNIKSHGDYFRFYEIGFRCCRDRTW